VKKFQGNYPNTYDSSRFFNLL